MAVTVTSNLTGVPAETPEVLSAIMVTAWRGALGFSSLITRVTDLETRREGNTVDFYVPHVFTGSTKTETGEYTPETRSPSNVQLVVDQHPHNTWADSELVKAFQSKTQVAVFQGTLMNAVTRLVEQAEETLLTVYTGFTNTDLGTPGVDLDVDIFSDAKKTLTDAKAPAANRIAVISTKDANALRKNDDLKKFLNSGSTDTLRNGELGTLHGMRIWESPYVDSTAGSPTTYHNFAVHAPSIVMGSVTLEVPEGLGVQWVRVTDPDLGISIRYRTWHNANKGDTYHSVDILFGYKALRGTAGVEIQG